MVESGRFPVEPESTTLSPRNKTTSCLFNNLPIHSVSVKLLEPAVASKVKDVENQGLSQGVQAASPGFWSALAKIWA